MRVLVTGSSGHLGEALVRRLQDLMYEVVSLDIVAGPFTTQIGSIIDRAHVKRCMDGVQMVFHAATLHKPHVATHRRQDFVDTNITGTLNLLEEAARAGVEAFVYTSTTSVFGDALTPPTGAPAAWVTEAVSPIPKNIYGVTKAAAEELCQLFHRNHGLAAIVLRTARFFPEEDDNRSVRETYADDNIKVNEYLYRRIDIDDVVSATTPFTLRDMATLHADAARATRHYVPDFEAEYARRDWRMVPRIDRVYVNERARDELGWQPRYDFKFVIDRLKADEDYRSPLARLIGSKGYHGAKFGEGPYPVE
jgi:nucleoside-diphosphate-sugar epimerase